MHSHWRRPVTSAGHTHSSPTPQLTMVCSQLKASCTWLVHCLITSALAAAYIAGQDRANPMYHATKSSTARARRCMHGFKGRNMLFRVTRTGSIHNVKAGHTPVQQRCGTAAAGTSGLPKRHSTCTGQGSDNQSCYNDAIAADLTDTGPAHRHATPHKHGVCTAGVGQQPR